MTANSSTHSNSSHGLCTSNSNSNSTQISQNIPTTIAASTTAIASTSVEFYMTSEQQRFINELLPKGYSFQFASKPIRNKASSLTKTQTPFIRSSSTQDQQHRSSASSNQAPAIVNATQQAQNRITMPEFHEQQLLHSQQYQAQQQFMPQSQQQQYGVIPHNQEQHQQQAYSIDNTFQYNTNQPIVTDNITINHMIPTNQPKASRKSQSKRPKPSQANSNARPTGNKKPKLNQAAGVQNMFGGAASGGMAIDESKHCFQILSSLQRHKSAGPFLRPVDPIKLGIPDYFRVIRDPMDLSTIEHNLRISMYQSTTQFAADVRKIWNNSYLYNPRDSPVYQMTVELDKYFEKKYKEMEQSVFGDSANIPYYVKILAQAINSNTNQAASVSQMHFSGGSNGVSAKSRAKPQQQQQQQQQQKSNHHAQSAAQAAPAVKKARSVPSKLDTPMTMQEKKHLGSNIMHLPPECLRGVWEIVKSDADEQYDDQILQFDIDQIPTRKARELEQYVKHQLSLLQKRMNKKAAKNKDKDLEHNNYAQQQQQQQLPSTQQLDHSADRNHHQMYSASTAATSSPAESNTIPRMMSNQKSQDHVDHYGQSTHNRHSLAKQGIANDDSDSSFISEDSESANY